MEDNKVNEVNKGPEISSVDRDDTVSDGKRRPGAGNRTMFIGLAVFFVVVLIFLVYFLTSTSVPEELDTATLPGDAGVELANDSGGNSEDDPLAYLQDMGWGSASGDFFSASEEFDLMIHIDSKDRELGAFSFDLSFDVARLEIVTGKGSDGLSKAEDGDGFMIMANPNDLESGFYKFSGICAKDCSRGRDLAVAVIHVRALEDLEIDNTLYELKLKELSDTMGKKIN